jgi:hypothetical protein
LKPTWPFSSRWIFHSEARMASAASSRVSPASARNRRSLAPTSIRWTVGPPAVALVSVMALPPHDGIATQSPTPPQMSRDHFAAVTAVPDRP